VTDFTLAERSPDLAVKDLNPYNEGTRR